jgi:hypothetical protein
MYCNINVKAVIVCGNQPYETWVKIWYFIDFLCVLSGLYKVDFNQAIDDFDHGDRERLRNIGFQLFTIIIIIIYLK